MTPLMYASREGRLTVIESLLAVTSDIDYQDNKGYTVCCVHLLCWRGKQDHLLISGCGVPAP